MLSRFPFFAVSISFFAFSVGVVSLPLSSNAITQLSQDHTKKLDAYLNDLEKYNQFMGSVALTKGQDIIYARSIGFDRLQPPRKLNSETGLRIASISKMFTATLTFKAIESGLISLDTPVIKYFPEIRSAEITISNLLNHRSGLPNYTNDPKYESYMTRPHSRMEMKELVLAPELDFLPDSKRAYSNSNYLLLTLLLEKVTGKTYGELLKEQIAEPLQLSNTYLGTSIKDSEAYSFYWDKKWKKETSTDMSIPLGAGAIISTPADLNRFLVGLFNGKLFNASSIEQMKDIKEGYGRGLFPMPFEKELGWGHTGRIDGFDSSSVYFPDSGIAVSVVSNGSRIRTDDVVNAVLKTYHKKPFSYPDFSAKPVKLSFQQIQQFVGQYSSADLPLKIEITAEKETLYAKATGQKAFPLTPYPNGEFRFAPSGVRIVFEKTPKVFILYQGGNTYKFER